MSRHTCEPYFFVQNVVKKLKNYSQKLKTNLLQSRELTIATPWSQKTIDS